MAERTVPRSSLTVAARQHGRGSVTRSRLGNSWRRGAEAPGKLKFAPLFLLLLASTASAQYYYTDTFASCNSSYWAINGSPPLTCGSSGLSNPSTYGGSMMALNNGGNGTRQEIRVTFGGISGSGTYNSADIYLGTNQTATLGYRLAFRTLSPGSLSLDVYDLNGVWVIGGTSFVYNPAAPLVVRAIKAASGIRVVIGKQAGWIALASNYSGSMGVGFTGGGNGPITKAELAAGDLTAPSIVSSVAAWPNGKQVDLQWAAATDNSGEIFQYKVYRDGAFLGSSRTTSFIDEAVDAGLSYNYTVRAEDFHGNEGPLSAVKAVTNTRNNIQQTGIRPFGSYWGGGGESIDMRSGNVNYTLGMLRAQSRHGLSMGFALSYDSQIWRYGDGQSWSTGFDVGYGFGWKLQAGSIYPVYSSNSSILYYVFTDSSGADYRLDYSSSNHYWSREGHYQMHYDPVTTRLWFNDGSNWLMGAVSGSTEPDAGTRYPTVATDSNGNQIQLRYKPAVGTAAVNTSARLDWIWDARAGGFGNVSYNFTYGTAGCDDGVPRLTGISTALPTGENYTFTYECKATVKSPFTPTYYQPRTALISRTSVSSEAGASLTHGFEYHVLGPDSTLELARVNFPYGGRLQWNYVETTTASNQKVRGVGTRLLKMSSTGTEYSYALARDLGAGWGYVDDADGK